MTVLVARRVTPGHEDQFEDWSERLTRTASRFSGFLGAGLLLPARAGDDWHVVYRFDTAEHLADWEVSRERAGLLAEADRLMRTVGVHRISGLETWFALPGRTAPAPPRWKMFAVSAVCIYSVQLFVYVVLGRLVSGWPLPTRLIIPVIAVTALMTWLVMPQVTRLLQSWLYPRHR